MRHITSILKSMAAPGSFEGQYDDPRWRSRAKEFRRSYGYCSSCRRKGVEMHVHHVNYTNGQPLWDADDTDLVVLCKSCHDLIHVVIKDFRSTASRCNASNIAAICKALKLLLQKHGETGTIRRLIIADEA